MAAHDTSNYRASAGRAAARAALVTDFRTYLAQAASLDDISGLLVTMAKELGFDYVALAEHGDLADPARPLLLITNYPPRWRRRFIAHRLDRSDPVQLACRTRTAGFRWTAAMLGPLAPRQRALLRASRNHGLHDGFTVHLPGARAASCSFAIGPGTIFPDAGLEAAELVARAAYDRLRMIAPGQLVGPGLSPRQRQCVTLLAAGLTDRGIARMLSLSEETVTKYLNAARRRYGVSRRAQLVAVALRDGVIGFDDLAAR